MRDWMMVGAMVLFVPLALRNAYGAYLLWCWTGLLAIQTFMYGFMRDVPYGMVFSLIALALILANKDSEKQKFVPNSASTLIIIFGIHAILVAAFAYPDIARNWELCINLLKTLLFCLLMPMLVTSRFRIHALIVTLALATAFHGLIEGLKFVSSGGAHLSQGNIKLGDRNHFAVMIVMIMPVLIYLMSYSASRLAKFGYFSVLIVNILSVISTQSRAGLITMLGLGVWYIIHGRRKILGIFAMGIVVLGILAVAPPEWTNRMDSIKTADEDSSFMGRVMAWKRGSAIAIENPILGGGFHSVQAVSIFEQFRNKQGILGFVETGVQSYPAAAHSIYFEVLGDMGFFGLFIFLSLNASAFINRRAIFKLTQGKRDDFLWARDLANALTACMLCYLIGGASISAGYFEMPYIIIMLMAVLRFQVSQQLKTPSSALAA
jgi:probable O-glycosylation ligase (exosortase A-associated)